jgi:hypothetical protein
MYIDRIPKQKIPSKIIKIIKIIEIIITMNIE